MREKPRQQAIKGSRHHECFLLLLFPSLTPSPFLPASRCCAAHVLFPSFLVLLPTSLSSLLLRPSSRDLHRHLSEESVVQPDSRMGKELADFGRPTRSSRAPVTATGGAAENKRGREGGDEAVSPLGGRPTSRCRFSSDKAERSPQSEREAMEGKHTGTDRNAEAGYGRNRWSREKPASLARAKPLPCFPCSSSTSLEEKRRRK